MSKFSPRLVRSKTSGSAAPQWRVILYNNHFHRLANVIDWLEKHAGCDEEFALEICSVCQDEGRSVCYQGSRSQCHEVAAALRLHGLQVEVDDY